MYAVSKKKLNCRNSESTSENMIFVNKLFRLADKKIRAAPDFRERPCLTSVYD